MRTTPVLLLAAGMVVVPSVTALADWERGKAAFDAGDLAGAEVEFRAEVAARPKWAGGHYMLGETLRRAGRTAEAVESLRRAVELEGGNASHRLGLGQGLLSDRRYDDVVAELGGMDPATLSAPERQTRAILMASAELARERPEAAVGLIEGERAAGVDGASLQRLRGHGLKGLGRSAEALEAFERAFEANPRDAESVRQAVNLALDLAARADTDGARDAMNRRAAALAEALAGIEPKSSSFELVARCLLAARQSARALPWVEKALEERPNDPGLLALAGWSLRCAGRAGEAVIRLRSALDNHPDADQKRRVHGQLARIAEGRLDLEEAARQHRLAGEAERAQRLDEIREGFRSSLDRLAGLRRQIDDVNARVAQLDALGQADAAAQVRARVAVLVQGATAIEANLEEVRKALRGSSDCS